MRTAMARLSRLSFTRGEITELRRLARELASADPDRQKAIRAKMRKMKFYISDFCRPGDRFTVVDFDELRKRGTITVDDDPPRD